MSWNRTNCFWALAFAPWGNGNAPASYYSGQVPSYPTGGGNLQNGGDPYGIVNNAGDCYYNSSGGIFDQILFAGNPEIDLASALTIEAWVYKNRSVDGYIYRKYYHLDGFGNEYTLASPDEGRADLIIHNSGTPSGWFKNAVLWPNNTWAHIVYVFDGPAVGNAGKLRGYLNGVEQVMSYTGIIPNTIANLHGTAEYISRIFGGFKGRVAWVALYSDADQTRAANNYVLGRDMGLIGNDDGAKSNMVLTNLPPPPPPTLPPPKPIYGNKETPVSLGSGSGYFHNPTDIYGQETRGGGAIELIARSGTVRVNGHVNMNGQDGTHSGGASGGSLWVKAWKIDGTGNMSADGGDTLLSDSSSAGGGGGGYISLWHGHTIDFDGTMSVDGGGYIGTCGVEFDGTHAGDGKIFITENEPIMEDRYTGDIWNTKWWDHTNSVTIDNDLTFSNPNGTYLHPVVDSLFNISGKEITTTIDYSPSGPDVAQYSASFLLYADEFNWVGLARRKTGLFGISSADGVISASGVYYPNTDVTLRLMKNDSTFTFQYYDATSAPSTIYTDYRPELAEKTWSVKMFLDKGLPVDTIRTDYLRLTPLDISRQYIDLDGTPADATAVALNAVQGTSQMFGLDFYTDGNKVKWDSTGLSDFHTPFVMFVMEYHTITPLDVMSRGLELEEYPASEEDIAVNVVSGVPQENGVDFIVNGNRIDWAERDLEPLIEVGDILRLTYYFDPWNVTLFSEIVAWEDQVRVMYGWDLPPSDGIDTVFDSFKIFDGVISNAETTEPVLYVDPAHGSDESSGRQLEPLQNLFVATAWAKRGSTVVLYDGTHNPTRVARKNLTLLGAEGTTSYITTEFVQDTTGSNWEDNGVSFYSCDGLIENVDLTSCRTAIYAENGDFSLLRNRIVDTSNAVVFKNSDPVIAQNFIRRTQNALDFTNSLTPYIYSNVVTDASVAVRFGGTYDATVSNNTLDNNQIHVKFDEESSGIVTSNNLTYSTVGIEIADFDASVASYNNNFYATALNYNGSPLDTSGNINANPLYYDRPNRDYHLNTGSPDIGVGTNDYDDFLYDFDGARRLHEDIGAFQFIDGTHPAGNYFITSAGDDHWNFGGIDDPFRTLDKGMSVADSTITIDGGHYDSFYLNLRSQNIDLNELYIYLGSIQHFASYLTLTPTDMTAGYVNLPTYVSAEDSSDVALNIIGGPAQEHGVDYTIQFGKLIWDGFVLDDFLEVGDTLRIVFLGPLQRKALDMLILHQHYSNYDQEKAVFVSPSGSDSTVLGGDGTNTGGTGSADLPFRTITKALAQSSPGDSIVAMAGEYPIFNGLENRNLVAGHDRTSIPYASSQRFFEEFFFPKDFRAYGTTEYDPDLWAYDFTGSSDVFTGGGFMNLTYDGTNSATADSSFEFISDFELTATLRNAIDPIKFMVTAPDNTAYFIYNDSQYIAGIITGGLGPIVCSGTLEGGDATNEENLITEYISITADDTRNKWAALSYIPEPSDCSNLVLNVVGGVPQNYAEDFYVEDSKIKWDGMSLDGELEPGEVLRAIYLDRSLSYPVTASISLEGDRFTIKAFDGTWHTVMKRDMVGSYSGPWKASFVMDETGGDLSHHCIYGKGFVNKFLAIADSFDNLSIADRSYNARTERRNIAFYNTPALEITTSFLEDATTATRYYATIDATGGSSVWSWPPPWSWQVSDGTVPSGIVFSDQQTHAVLDGTPSSIGDYTFTVRLTDYGSQYQSTEKTFNLKVD